MSGEGFFVIDPETNEAEFLSYAELDELGEEVRNAILRPVGGFCYPADFYLTLSLAQAPFYVKDWLPKHGKACVYAPAKAGKSYLSAQLARCVGAGEPFLGIPTERGKVLYIQCEIAPEILQQRLRSTGLAYSNVYIGTTFSMKLDTEAGQTQLHRAVEAIEPDVIILDPLYKLMQGEENESHDVLKVINFLDALIEGGLSIWIVHHPGKDIKRGGRGSSVLDDWVDSYIEMRRISQPGETLRVRLTPKLLRHSELPPEPIEAELAGFEFEVVGAREQLTARLLRMFMPNEGVRVSDIVKETLASRSGVNKALEQLVAQKKVERVERGIYQLVL